MKSSDTIQKLAEALAAAQSEFKIVGTSGENKFDKYTYAKLEDYVAAIKPILPKHGLSILTSVDEVLPLDDRTTKNGGTEHAVRVKITARLMHSSGEWIEAGGIGEGQDRSDKSVYKAITGARKYALASALGLATSDDPEGDENVGTAGKPAKGDLPEDAKVFLGTYTDVMTKRGCQPAKAQQILKNLLAKKKMKLADVTAADRDKILAGVRNGEWDKYFAPPAKQPPKQAA